MPAFALQAVTAFNLVCTGTQTTGLADPSAPIGIRGARERPITDIYRVDLEHMRWCAGACSQTNDISSVTGKEIVLESTQNEAGGINTLISINRESGRYLFSNNMGRMIDGRFGTCERAPFGGMPSLRF